MRTDEATAVSRLAGLVLSGGTTRIHEAHAGIAGRAFAGVGPAARPVQAVHDTVAALTYRTVGAALGAGASVLGALASRRVDGRPLDDSPAARVALAVLNGAHGDLLDRETPALATAMTVRCAGQAVPLEADALQVAFPHRSGRLVVFLHGLTETEASWGYRSERHHGRPGITYGTLLEQDLGLTPVLVRYNTGLHVSDNGRRLADLLDDLVEAWPVPVQDLVLIGHSMGGLVARSALHQAGGGTGSARPWTRLVRDTITLGTPHLGAPLESGAHALTHTLARLPETRPLATLLAARSVGIKDLRRGTLVEDDWVEQDLDARTPGPHTHVPLHDGARHFVVLATLAADPTARTADLLGDLLVPPRSATGDSGGDDRLAFPPDHVHRLGRLHHFDLLNHPQVYAQIRRWLETRPEGPSPSAPAGA
jgi:pimeloyl-ACP methyl ester carboxylesterase